MKYVDGFVLAVPKKNLPAYRRMAQRAGRIWREYGALEYRECVGDDLKVPMGMPFPRLARLKPGETVCFSCDAFLFHGSRPGDPAARAQSESAPRRPAAARRRPSPTSWSGRWATTRKPNVSSPSCPRAP